MSPDIQFEARLLVLSVLTGAALMAAYDLLRLFRAVMRHSWLWVGIEDLFYWGMAGFAVFYLLYRENDGAIRLYVIGAVFLSMAAYDHFCSTFLRKVLKKLKSCFRIKKISRQRDEERRTVRRENRN